MKLHNPWLDSQTKTISITSGKGGVGKTTLCVNIALAMAQKGKKVLILDGDLGMANVDIFFGVRSQGNIHDVLEGTKSIQEVMIEVSPDVFIIPGGSGLTELNRLNSFQRRQILESVQSLPQRFDYLIVDTAPGISDNVLYLNSSAQEICLVLTPDPSSFADSYSLIKVLHQEFKENHFSIICNMVRDSNDGYVLFQKFQDVVHRFLNVGLTYMGAVPLDTALRKANQMQRLIMRHDPESLSSLAIRQVSQEIERNLNVPNMKSGLQFYFEQVMGMA